jgi:hypothetical protein
MGNTAEKGCRLADGRTAGKEGVMFNPAVQVDCNLLLMLPGKCWDLELSGSDWKSDMGNTAGKGYRLADRRTAEKEGVMFNPAVQVSFVYTRPLRGLLGLVDE